ncbi:late embryogenesis abundant protein At1g64065-like [Rhodamnia argentea]|uniref:Late embryogenesis abundant protein At1g64065-like n=1 Tax=Rhodamnia argentea TaxID=178133 RepID=A0A8B8P8F6_9MYRT|nr:late embryogenesis abundant protein At1g64065-like [Rhodamnia argentea]
MNGSRNNTKCLANVAAFVIFQAAVVLIFAFTVMRVRSPKVGLGAVTVDSFSAGDETSSPSFNMRITAQVTVKNTNFGHFRYGNGTMSLAYNGMVVGDAAIVKGTRAKARETTKFNVTVDVTSGRLASTASLGADVNSGVSMLSGDGKVRGKVELLKMMKRRKSGVMDCTLNVNLATRAVITKCK